MALTPKQEKFAQEVASGKSQAEAYRIAFNAAKMKPETIWSRASELMADGKVSARVAELRAPIVEKVGLTLEAHLERLAELSAKAETSRQYSAAIAAEVARGKAAGVHIEQTKSDVTVTALPASVKEFV